MNIFLNQSWFVFIKYFEEIYVETIGIILAVIAMIMCLIYSVKLIIIAFQESVLWGLLYLFFPFANLYFIITRWQECREPFLKSLIAIVVMVVGFAIAS